MLDCSRHGYLQACPWRHADPVTHLEHLFLSRVPARRANSRLHVKTSHSRGYALRTLMPRPCPRAECVSGKGKISRRFGRLLRLPYTAKRPRVFGRPQIYHRLWNNLFFQYHARQTDRYWRVDGHAIQSRLSRRDQRQWWTPLSRIPLRIFHAHRPRGHQRSLRISEDAQARARNTSKEQTAFSIQYPRDDVVLERNVPRQDALPFRRRQIGCVESRRLYRDGTWTLRSVPHAEKPALRRQDQQSIHRRDGCWLVFRQSDRQQARRARAMD